MNRSCMVMVLGLVSAMLIGCKRGEVAPAASNQVVVYTSVDRFFSEPVLQAAEKRLSIKVIGVYDTEETKSTGLVNRLIAKKDKPDADIFWSGDPARSVLLKAKRITEPYDSPAAQGIPEQYKDTERHWVGFSARTRVLLVNSQQVKAGEEPRSLFDLIQPKWKGRVAIANPLFGTTSFHLAAIFEALGDEKALQWLDGLKANGVQVLTSNGEVKRQVAGGQVAVGLTDSDDAAEAMADNQPVRAVFLDQEARSGDALGNLVIPNTLSLIHGRPNPDGARKVFDFLLSDESMRMLADSCAQAPLRAGVDVPAHVLKLDKVVPMKTNYAAAAEHLERIMPMLKEWVDRR